MPCYLRSIPVKIEEITREATAILMIVLGIVVLTSLLTYTPEDYRDVYETGGNPEVPKNKIGWIGKVMSHFLYRNIGVAGFPLVFFIFMWGGMLAFSREKVQFFWYRFIASLFLVFSCSLFASLNTFSSINPAHPELNTIYEPLANIVKHRLNLGDVGLGGTFGYVSALASIRLTGRIGSEIIAAGLILITLEFSFGFLFSSLIASMVRWLKSVSADIKAKKAASKKDPSDTDPVAEPEIKVKKEPEKKNISDTAKSKEDKKQEKKRKKKKKKEDKKKQSGSPKPEEKKKTPVAIPDSEEYVLPPSELLEEPRKISRDETEVQEVRARTIEEVLQNFNISGKVVAVNPGPVITQYEIELGAGVRVNSIFQLSDNLSMALQSPGIRIEAPIPGKSTVGIEVPNKESEFVKLRNLMDLRSDSIRKANIPLLLGKDSKGKPIGGDLSKMPHMLIAGATGSGKTVCINSLIISILMHKTPDEVKMIIIDPKMVDMAAYKSIPHLLTPVVTDIQKAESVLNWGVGEMERRYKLFSISGARDIRSFNSLKKEEVLTSLEESGNPNIYQNIDIPHPMPYVIVIVDELADLMFSSPKEIEFAVTRIAQKARAAGIHLVLSTQRPSVDVITGLIKSNIPCRIAFQVAAKVDSRTILDMNGAETLLGRGDMLFLPPGTAKATRAQGVYVSDTEINAVVDFCKGQAKPAFSRALKKAQSQQQSSLGDLDEGLEDAIRITVESQRGSASLLQRKLGYGYNRATGVVETLAVLGVVGPHKGSKARDVLLTPEELEDIGGLQGLLDRYEQQSQTDKG